MSQKSKLSPEEKVKIVHKYTYNMLIHTAFLLDCV